MAVTATPTVPGVPAPVARSGASGRWGSYLLHRLAGAAAVLLTLVVVTFFIIRLVPGDPARLILGPNAGAEQVAQVRLQLGLDDPLPVQFWHYLTGLVTGDMGESFRTSQPVLEMLTQRLPVTATLALCSLAVVLLLGFPIGILVGYGQSRRKENWTSRTFTAWTSLLGAVPEYFMGALLITVFALSLQVLPAQGGGSVQGFVLPALAVGLGSAAVFARLVRNETIATLDQEYIATALSKRVPVPRLLFVHVLPNVVTSTLSLGGLILVSLLGGTVITENVFNIAGLGSEVVSAVLASDYPSVQGIVLLIGILSIGINLIVDVVLGLIDPRVLTAGR